MAMARLLMGFALALVASAQIPDVVIPLNNDNFEHHTQATTGQTAGHWFVLFNAALSPHTFRPVHELWAELAADEDKEVIFAEVVLDDKDNKFLARQFINIQPPSAVLFRDQQMYVFPYSLTGEGVADRLREFWKGHYTGQVDPKAESGWGTTVMGATLILVGIMMHTVILVRSQKAEAEKKKLEAKVDPLAPKEPAVKKKE